VSASRPTLEQLAEGVIAGDRAVLSRAITLAESKRTEDQDLAQDLLVRLADRTGSAIRLGLTGVPGAGKSTAIETLGLWLVERGHRVAVLVIDPSSARSGGSILGDKTRMPQLSLSDAAYIRPSPAAGVLGGVAWRTREAMLLCEAAGFDVVIVESVGVGQSEAELAEIIDTFCLLLVPGAGDELQGIKRGIVEMADLIVVNKADGDNVTAAKRAAGDYRHALRMLPPSTPGWETPVLTFSARDHTGLEELWDTILGHRELLASSGLLEQRRAHQQQRWLQTLLNEQILREFRRRPGFDAALAQAQSEVGEGQVTVPQAVRALLQLPSGS
jgi:LAO/AO transport system kinase